MVDAVVFPSVPIPSLDFINFIVVWGNDSKMYLLDYFRYKILGTSPPARHIPHDEVNPLIYNKSNPRYLLLNLVHVEHKEVLGGERRKSVEEEEEEFAISA